MNTTVPILVIGLVIAFGVGFVVGERTGDQVVFPPANYDPSASALKLSEEHSKRCYDLLVQHVIDKGGATDSATKGSQLSH